MILLLKIIACLCFWCSLDLLLLALLRTETNFRLADLFIPANLYDAIRVNWFGAWFLSIIANIVGLPFAIVFWIYQLCTIGRD